MSYPGSFFGSKAPCPPAMMIVRVKRSPRSVITRRICRSASSGSGSYSTRSQVVSRWTGTSNCSIDWTRSCSTRSFAMIRGNPGTS